MSQCRRVRSTCTGQCSDKVATDDDRSTRDPTVWHLTLVVVELRNSRSNDDADNDDDDGDGNGSAWSEGIHDDDSAKDERSPSLSGRPRTGPLVGCIVVVNFHLPP